MRWPAVMSWGLKRSNQPIFSFALIPILSFIIHLYLIDYQNAKGMQRNISQTNLFYPSSVAVGDCPRWDCQSFFCNDYSSYLRGGKCGFNIIIADQWRQFCLAEHHSHLLEHLHSDSYVRLRVQLHQFALDADHRINLNHHWYHLHRQQLQRASAAAQLHLLHSHSLLHQLHRLLIYLLLGCAHLLRRSHLLLPLQCSAHRLAVYHAQPAHEVQEQFFKHSLRLHHCRTQHDPQLKYFWLFAADHRLQFQRHQRQPHMRGLQWNEVYQVCYLQLLKNSHHYQFALFLGYGVRRQFRRNHSW